MKKKLVCILILLFCACETISEPRKSTQKISNSEILSYLSSQGFDLSNHVLNDDHILVEGDLYFSLKDLKEEIRNPTKTRNKQWTNDWYIVKHNYASAIRFRIDPSVPKEWKKVILWAKDQWNSINGTNLKFLHNDRHYQTVIRYDVNSYTQQHAYVTPPKGGEPAEELVIRHKPTGWYKYIKYPLGNNEYRWKNYSDEDRKKVILHEFGHIIGLLHMNPSQLQQRLGFIIDGTNRTDRNSIMETTFEEIRNSEFSYYDKVAVQELYPPYGSYIKVYQDKGYKGRRLTIAKNEKINRDMLREFNIHNRISSVKTYNGARAVLYRDRDYKDDNMLIEKNYYDLDDYDFDNRISSIDWRAPTGKYAIFYKDKYYKGRPLTVTGNIYKLSSYGFNNVGSSVKVFNGARLRLYKNWKYQGSSLYISSNKSSLGGMDNKATSLKLYK